MVSKRDRILNIANFLNQIGVEVNIGKNFAQGNKGFFKVKGANYRIDISKKQDDEVTLCTLIHEFAHYIHYSYDKTLKSLDFIFSDYNGNFEEELIELTVDSINKDSIRPLFESKNSITQQIKNCSECIKKSYPDFKHTKHFKTIENKILKSEYKYLLSHDSVKVFSGFGFKFYSIDKLNTKCMDIACINYLKLLSYKRALKRINSRISKLNRYYSSSTELFARSIEYFLLKPDIVKSKTPQLYAYYSKIISDYKIPYLNKICEFLM